MYIFFKKLLPNPASGFLKFKKFLGFIYILNIIFNISHGSQQESFPNLCQKQEHQKP